MSTEQRLQGCIDRCIKGTGGRKQTVKQEAMAMCQLKERGMAVRSRLDYLAGVTRAQGHETQHCVCAPYLLMKLFSLHVAIVYTAAVASRVTVTMHCRQNTRSAGI